MNRPHAHSLSAIARFGLGVLANLVQLIGGLWRALDHRGEVKALAELDERTLKDIGLSRNDVDGALAEPFYRNPSLILVRAAEERTGIERSVPRPVRPVVPVVNIAR